METRRAARAYVFLLLPPLVVMVCLFLLPLGWVAITSFFKFVPPGGMAATFTLENYRRFLTDAYYLRNVLGTTVRLSLWATVSAVLIGYMGGYLVARSAPRWKPALLFAVMAPMWVNLVIRVFGWMIVLSDNGVVNKLLRALGLIAEPLNLMYNEIAVTVGMIQVSVPFVILSLYGVLEALPRELEEAALSVGATPWRAFLRVTLPLSLPGVMAGSVLSFGLNTSSYLVPRLMGGGKIPVLPIAAYEQVMLVGNMPFAAAMGLVLLAVTLLSLGLYTRILKRLGARDTAMLRGGHV